MIGSTWYVSLEIKMKLIIFSVLNFLRLTVIIVIVKINQLTPEIE